MRRAPTLKRVPFDVFAALVCRSFVVVAIAGHPLDFDAVWLDSDLQQPNYRLQCGR